MPKLSRAAVLWDIQNPSPRLNAIEAAAGTMGIQLQALELQNPHDLQEIVATIKKGGAQGLVLLSSPPFR